MAKHILIVAGEASGDLHAAKLVEKVRAVRPDVEFFGMGGENMRQAGVKVLLDLKESASKMVSAI